jgi:hypothetical protein
MQKTLAALTLTVGIGIACCQNAAALPGSGGIADRTAPATSLLQKAQYTGYTTRHGVVKCYREFVVGPYRCHRYWDW